MRTKFRLALQISLIGTSLWLMVGCFYIPTKHKAVDGGLLPDDAIGAPDSGKPLILHHSTADDARRVLGQHLVFSSDGRHAIYTCNVRTGYTVWPLCFYSDPDTEWKYLQLRFDAGGRLTGFDVFDDWQQATRDTGIQNPHFNRLPTSRPAPLSAEQEERIRRRLVARRQSETRPTAAPVHSR